MTVLQASLRGLAACASLSALLLIGCGNGTTTVAVPKILTVTYGGSLTAQLGLVYSGAFSVSGGTSPYRCALSSGTLPSGLTLSASACTLTGTTAGVVGSFPISVTATDSASPTGSGSVSLTLTVTPATLAITTTSLPAGAAGLQYAATVATTGGTAPISCKILSGNADGLSISSGCTLTGIPTAAGTFSLTVQATDAASTPQTATATLSLSISATPNTRVASGKVPMVGAAVQIYAAGTTGNGSAPSALLSSPLTTDSFGSFTLPSASAYTCPSASAVVYLVSTGGRVGASGTSTPGAVFMAAPGTCSSLATTANLVLDEATTAGSAYAFAQFLKTGSPAQLGATSTNLAGLTAALATANNLVPASTGLAATVGSLVNGAPQTTLNLVANILNACVAGGPSSAACTTLYGATAVNGVAPADTLSAAINLAQNPAIASAALYALVPSSPAFTPSLAAAPSDWTLAVSYTGGGMSHPAGLGIDSTGRIWVANDNPSPVVSLFTNLGVPVFASGVGGNGLYDSFAAVVDANDNVLISNLDGGVSFAGSVTSISKTGAAVSGFPTTAGGVYYPIGLAVDTNGLIWVADYGDSSITILKPGGTASISIMSNQFGFPTSVAVDTNHYGWIANQAESTVTKVSPDGTSITSYTVGTGPTAVAIDAANNVWTTNYFASGIGLVSSAGVVRSPFPGYTGSSLDGPEGLAIDGNGSVWVSNYHGNSLTELAGASTANPGTLLGPSAGWGVDAAPAQAYADAIDASGNIWVTCQASNTLLEFVGLAAPVKTPMIGVVAKP